MVDMCRQNEEYQHAKKIVQRRERAEARIKEHVKRHRIMDLIEVADVDSNNRMYLQFSLGTMLRVDLAKIPLDKIEDYKSESEVWRKQVGFNPIQDSSRDVYDC